MVLYRKTSEDDKTKGISIYNSDNLIDWQWKSHIPGFFECPDLIQLKVTNRPDELKWILFDGDGSYLIGAFDGEKFTSESAKIKSDFGNNYYATQTWSNIPKEDGRTLQIAWMRGGKFPEMPFNGQMSFPCELYLTKFSFGYKLVRKPVKEIELQHGKHYKWNNKNLIPGIKENIVKGVKGDCLRIIGEFDLKTSESFGFMVRQNKKNQGAEILFNRKRGTLSVLNSIVPVVPVDNKISLEILIDRASIEIFINGGQTVVSNCFTPVEDADDLILFTTGGELMVDKLDIYKMESAWSEK
jgi:sucrose-6-phosphate hydrolase SacC (GH32 family)